MKLTDKIVQTLKPDDGRNDQFFADDKVPGFGVRVRVRSDDSIHRTFGLLYRSGGKQHRPTIGEIGQIKIDDARKAAQRWFGEIALGRDPGAERAQTKTPTLLFGALVQKYLDANQTHLRPASFKAATRHFRLHWLPLARRPVDEIKRAEIASQLHNIVQNHGRPSASRARSVLSALFSWAMREGLCEANPVIGTNDPGQGPARDRILTDDELVAVWRACQEDDFGRIVRLLILTGCRESEIGSAKWSEFDGDQFTIPGDRTKNHRPHTLTLPPLAMQIIEPIPRETDFLFGAQGRGFKQWGPDTAKLKARLPNMREWRLHDLRRTFRSGLARIGIRPDIAERAVNHATGNSVSKIYDRYRYGDEIAAALLRWANHIDAIVNGLDHRNVIPMKK